MPLEYLNRRMSAVSDLLKRSSKRQEAVPSGSAVDTLLERRRTPTEVARPPGRLEAIGLGLKESILPTAAGLGASAAVLAAVPTGGVSLLAIPAGIAVGYGASRLQDMAAKKILPKQRVAFLQRLGLARQAHPVASAVGEFLPALAVLRPGIPRRLPQIRTATISGGIQGGLEAGAEAIQGEGISPGRIATSTAVGALLNRPTRLGRRLFPEIPRKPIEAPVSAEITPPVTPEPPSLSSQVAEAIKAARPVRQQQEALYHQRRQEQLGEVLDIRERLGGLAGHKAELGALKGRLPRTQFEAVRSQFTEADVDTLMNTINSHIGLDPWEPITARGGILKALEGQVPTPNELDLLERVFGPEMVKALQTKRPLLRKLTEAGVELSGVSKSLRATADMSFPLRQGAFLLRFHKQWRDAFSSMIPQFFSEKAFQASQAEIFSRPTAPAMKKAGLSLTEIGRDFSKREEQFISRLAETIPGVRASNRAYVGMGNRLRADVFDYFARTGEQLGIDRPMYLPSAAWFINAATGRGGLGSLEQSATLLNAIGFAPRFVSSRLSLFNPSVYVGKKLDPLVRKEALKSLFTFAGLGITTISLARLGGAETSSDPRSTDFGKIKVGNTRIDLWAGFQQPLVAAARILSGATTSPITGETKQLGEGYPATTRLDIAMRFLESKESPLAGFITSLLRGKNIVGEPFELTPQLVNLFVPLILEDLWDIIQDQSPNRVGLTLPAFFGTGVQTFGRQIPSAETTPTGKQRIAFRGTPSVGESVVNFIRGRATSNLPEALHPSLLAVRDAKRRAERMREQVRQSLR